MDAEYVTSASGGGATSDDDTYLEARPGSPVTLTVIFFGGVVVGAAPAVGDAVGAAAAGVGMAVGGAAGVTAGVAPAVAATAAAGRAVGAATGDGVSCSAGTCVDNRRGGGDVDSTGFTPVAPLGSDADGDTRFCGGDTDVGGDCSKGTSRGTNAGSKGTCRRDTGMLFTVPAAACASVTGDGTGEPAGDRSVVRYLDMRFMSTGATLAPGDTRGALGGPDAPEPEGGDMRGRGSESLLSSRTGSSGMARRVGVPRFLNALW